MKKIILNHKSYLSYEEITKYIKDMNNIKTKEELIIFPSINYLALFALSKYKVGAQNFYSYNYGSYTGEVCLESLKSMNVNYTIVSHPERILLRLDSYEEMKDKLFRSLNMDFKTILCVGHDNSIKTIKKELKFYLKGVEYDSLKNLLIAYEPASHIDSSNVNLNEIAYVTDFIKKYMQKHYEIDTPILYGGGISKDKISDVLKLTDGVLIGKTSTNIQYLKEILKSIE